MTRKLLFKAVILLSILSLAFCQKTEKPNNTRLTKQQTDLDAAVPAKDIPVVHLKVPFKAQVPPGTWKRTGNCSPACFAMLYAFDKKIRPTEKMIRDFNDWAFQTRGDSINNYNGAKRGYSFPTLADYAKRMGYDNSSAARGSLPILIEILNSGQPVIVSVKRKMNNSLKNRHAMLITGIDSTHIYVNDPGKSSGNNNSYPLEQFLEVWRTGYNSYFVLYNGGKLTQSNKKR